MKNKKLLKKKLDKLFDEWYLTESTNENNPIGRRGPDGFLCSHSINSLFNEVMIKIEYNEFF